MTSAGRGSRCGTTTTGSSTTSCTCPTTARSSSRSARWSGSSRCWRSRRSSPSVLERFPGFARRLRWFLRNRPGLASLVSRWDEPGVGERRLLALVRGHRMKAILRRMLDPDEFLSPYGIRSLSRYPPGPSVCPRYRRGAPRVDYEPAESQTALFGGNSNWRGPIWFPINFLLIEALQKFHHYYGDDFLVESPTGSGEPRTLDEVAD